MRLTHRLPRLVWLLPLAMLVAVLGLKSMTWFATRPTSLGVQDGRLAPCPASPNCVTSQGPPSHYIAPEPLTGSAAETLAQLQTIIRGMSGGAVITAQGNYLHAEFTSRWFRFVDDVEFLVDDSAGQVHFRSASRVGHSDLGANRRRIEEIRRRLRASGTAIP